MVKIEVKPTICKTGVASTFVEVESVSEKQYAKICDFLTLKIDSARQVSDAFAESFVHAIDLCRGANPSDIWQHVIYRKVLSLGYSDQQWKRISGFALERALAAIYQPRLTPHGLRIRPLPKSEAHDLLSKLGFKGEIKKDKIDSIVEQRINGVWTLIAGLHVKASLAERIQDDVPASLALMSRGILSIVLTMDSKSYPPPHGSGINFGELGGRSFDKADGKARIKRQYIEDDGQFDALFSFNLRTPPSKKKTPSGKRIITMGLNEPQPDPFVSMLLEHINQGSGIVTS